MKTKNFKFLIMLLTALFVVGNCNTGWTKNVDDKIKCLVDDISDSLKKAVDKMGDDLNGIQHYLDNYHWKGLIQEEAASGPVTLRHLQLNGHSKAVIVKPGERIAGIVQCNLNRDQSSALSLYRVVLGIKGKGPQVTIGNELGIAAHESLEKFDLIAPTEPGLYQVRFRTVTGLFESNAFDAWVEKGNEPDGTTTIGIIFVKS